MSDDFWGLVPALLILTLMAGAIVNPLGTLKALWRLIDWLENHER